MGLKKCKGCDGSGSTPDRDMVCPECNGAGRVSSGKKPWLAIGLLLLSTNASAIDQERLADAIYSAEGAKVPYGILSVPVKNEAEARRVCLNTINNNLARWQWARQNGDQRDFIDFLGDRYCPVGAENDNGTNRFWKKNVKEIYATLGV